jgi:hypothetical protein
LTIAPIPDMVGLSVAGFLLLSPGFGRGNAYASSSCGFA